MRCPNRNHPDWIELENKLGEDRAYLEYIKNGFEIPDPIGFNVVPKNERVFKPFITEDEVNFKLRVIKALEDLSVNRKTIKLNSKESPYIETNLRKDLSNRGVPKEQIDFVFQFMRKQGLHSVNTEDLALALASQYSYSVEINRGRTKNLEVYEDYEYFNFNGYEYTNARNAKGERTYVKRSREFPGAKEVTKEEYDRARVFMLQQEDSFSSFYNDLVVPGGFNYTEQEISTPLIKPSIQGHASFSTDNGIGWFRSDEQIIGGQAFEEVDAVTSMVTKSWYTGELTKTRRILELQSDLFQKGRDREDLTGTYSENVEGVGEMVGLEERPSNPIGNQFLQLLNKDNNWVTFFVKSIIQDSAKKGYEKVLFPLGNTASKIEGHESLEEFKKRKENRIKELEKEIKESPEIIKEVNVHNIFRREIEQLKQELERVEREGFGALRPIYNFYENIISNILRKLNYKTSKHTDEYGNSWNEVQINRDSEREIYFSLKSEQSSLEQERQQELKDSIKNFLDVNGISYEAVSEIRDRNGELLNVTAIADIVSKSIKVIEGQERVEILGEEAGHFLVEMLGEDSPLYQSMMSEIENYDIYQEVVANYGGLPSYKADSTKLKKEAVGQLIGRMIAGTYEDVKTEERVGRWWNRVLRFLKDKIKSLVGIEKFEESIVSYNPFSEAAQMILSEQALGDEYLNNVEFDDVYFAINRDEQNRIANDVQNKHQIRSLGGDKGYERVASGGKVPVKNRVTDRVARWSKTRFTKERSSVERLMDEVKAKYGTAGHQDIQNIILRAKARREGTIEPSRQHSLPEDMYSTLEKHFNEFVDRLPADSVILPEITLYDSQQDEAGTVDLLVINSDGSVSIYDWKFIDFGNRKEIARYKRLGWEIQIPRYQQILRSEYGVTKFRQARVIPISAKYKGKDLRSIEIGNADVNAITEEERFLQPVPMSEEMTGVESLDRIILSLLSEKSEWENKRPSANLTPLERDTFYANRTTELKRIEKSISDIQLRHDLTEYIDRGIDLMKTLSSAEVSSIPTEELLNLVEVKLKRYGHEMIGLVRDLNEDMDSEIKQKLSTLVTNAQAFESKFIPELGVRIAEEAGERAMDERKAKDWWSRTVLRISQHDDPLVQSLWDLIKRSKTKTRETFENLAEEVNQLMAELYEEGLSGPQMFSWMIKEKANGELATVDKYSSEFYEKLTRAREVIRDKNSTKAKKEAAKKWIQNNTEFNKDAYERDLEGFKLVMNRNYKEFANKEQLVHERVEDWKNQYSNNSLGLSNSNNHYLKIKDNPVNYSTEFQEISKSPAKTKFYNLWMEKNKEFIKLTGVGKKGNFIWNVPNNLIERAVQNGPTSIVNRRAWQEQFYLRQGEELGMIDPDTGKPLMQIPVYYHVLNTRKDSEGKTIIDNRNQSRNLGEVLLQVGAMAYNHKHMSEIETSAQLLKYGMSIRPTLAKSSSGGVLRDQWSNVVKKAAVSSSDLEHFEDFLNYYIYGKNLKSTDYTFKRGDKTYSSIAIFNVARKWFVGKALALNPVSIVANGVGGHYMAIMSGMDGRLFKASDYNKAASWDLPRKDETSYQLIGLANILDRDDLKRTIRKKTSYNFLTRELTYDNLFLGQRGGDWWIRNSVLVAMAKKYKVEDGEVKRVGKEDSPSLYDYMKSKTSNGELDLTGLNEGQFEKFVEAVQNTSDTILGNSSRDDINAFGLTIGMRALTTFRSWIPGTFEARYGTLKYDKERQLYSKGRYKTFFSTIWNKKVGQLSLDMVKGFGLFGYGLPYGEVTKEHAKQLWIEELEKNPELSGMTQEEYYEMHIANLRSMMTEIYSYLSVLGLIMLASPDDDETLEQGSFRKYVYEQLERVKMEIATFWHPAEFVQMIKSPIPMVNIYNDIGRLGYLLFNVPYKYAVGEEDDIVLSKARRAITGNIPLASGVEKMYSFFDENYERAIRNHKD